MIAAYRAMAEHMPDNGLQIVMFTHQDAGVWADMASIVWGAGLRVTAAWYIATETTSELKKGGYVQGTVLLVLRKRLADEGVYRDELVQEVRGGRPPDRDHGRPQPGDARARSLGKSVRGRRSADGGLRGGAARADRLHAGSTASDMTAEALRPRAKGERDLVKEIIDFAVQVANEHLVPERRAAVDLGAAERRRAVLHQDARHRGRGAEEARQLPELRQGVPRRRLRRADGLDGANKARLKKRRRVQEGWVRRRVRPLGPTRTAVRPLELQRDVDSDEVMSHLRDQVAGYWTRREDLMALAQAIAQMRETALPQEAEAARILSRRIKNERLGG